jgi:uncharacterized membrane protein
MEPESLGEELNDQDRILLLFAYLGPLAVVSLVASRREFVKWHAKQGLVLGLALAAAYLAVLRPAIALATRYLWSAFVDLFWAATWLVALGAVAVTLVCVVRALEGERFKLPGLGDLADRL